MTIAWSLIILFFYSISKERLKLDLIRKDVMHSVQLGLCPSCQSKRGNDIIVDLVSKYSATSRVPGDGGEGHAKNRMEKHNSVSWKITTKLTC